MKEKKNYEEPALEIVEFKFEESIATSTLSTSLWEEIW